MSHAVLVGALILLFSSLGQPVLALSKEADKLRHISYAQLENEKPAEAEQTLLQLTKVAPNEPLAWANLAISRLRQQSFESATEAIERALKLAGPRGDLLAIRGEVEQWGGLPEAALRSFEQAATLDPNDPEIQYSLLRQTTTVGDEALEQRKKALDRLVQLRPENLVVLLGAGQLAIDEGNRQKATGVFLRIGELLWQAPAVSQTALQRVNKALNEGETAKARVPAQQLSNVLKITAMYQQGLRELSTGIQGIPLRNFLTEPATEAPGEPLSIRFQGQKLSGSAGSGRALAVADFDGDEHPDIAWVTGGDKPALEVWDHKGGFATASETLDSPAASRLRAIDLDNDGQVELLATHAQGGAAWQKQAKWTDAAAPFGLKKATGSDLAAIDFDIEGDLDLVVVGPDTKIKLLRNTLEGPLESVGSKSLGALEQTSAKSVAVSDLDRDGDLDVIVAGEHGLTWLDNLRQGEFVDRTASSGLSTSQSLEDVISADLDNDGWPDLIAAGKGLFLFHNLGGRFEPWDLGQGLQTPALLQTVIAFDADNDGRLDLAAAGPKALVVLQQDGTTFRFVSFETAPAGASAIEAADLDADGDLDLVVAGSEGLFRLTNHGGNVNGWLSLNLRGLTKGNSKNNVFGVGSVVEIRGQGHYQFREATGAPVHFGLGKQDKAEIVRVVWTNGVPQNRFAVASQQTLVEEQLLKGSCPFLYVATRDGVHFVTDLLWGAPIGLPVAAGKWAGADPGELVRVDGAEAINGVYDLRVTEELWEAAFFDQVKLWVVDAPEEVEVASNLTIIPGQSFEEKVLATRNLRAVDAAWDGTGADVTARLSARDDIYAGGWDRLPASPYQGVMNAPYNLTFDLGSAPDQAIRLHLDGWIFPSDASLNLAVDQRSDLPAPGTRLEVETETGWQPLVDPMGFPAGKTKTMVVDTPPLPAGATRLRIVTTQWLAWDRLQWSTSQQVADHEIELVAKLDPAVAELRYRGFSRLVRNAPNAPHGYDYSTAEQQSPWLPFAGRYTRFGDVRELLAVADDRSVILAPGDEIQLLFDTSDLPEPAPGWHRTVFLESQGWDKDADRNTYEGNTVEPLPFRAMSGYPYGEDEAFPDSPIHRRYKTDWLTREVLPSWPVASPEASQQGSSRPNN